MLGESGFESSEGTDYSVFHSTEIGSGVHQPNIQYVLGALSVE
jgi:hypothetical protein